ncbi:hypothetical protein NFI96_021158, partial [Prochilodus magdalenae]
YRRTVDHVVLWSNQYNLELDTANTVAMTVDFRRNPPALPALTILDRTVVALEFHRLLGTTITKDLKWDCNLSSIIKKVQQRMYFLHHIVGMCVCVRMSVFVYCNQREIPSRGYKPRTSAARAQSGMREWRKAQASSL